MAADMVRSTDNGMGLDEAIAAYLAACEVEGKSPRTVDAYAETLARFRGICLQLGLPQRIAAFGPAHVYAFLKVIADSGGVARDALLDVCDPTTEFGCRNRAIILLFLDTGLRYTELHRLTLADVSWETRRIHIRHGKGRKQRVVPFGDGPDEALRDYIARFRSEAPGALCSYAPA